MKLFKYIFILLMLFAQQAIAYTADCQSKLDQCKANLITYANWGDGAYGSCAFSLSVQPNGEGGNAFVGTFEGGYIVGGVKQPSNTSCWFNCPSGQAVNEQGNCITCPSGQVPAESGRGCTFPPNSGSTTANPTPNCVGSACCVYPQSYDPLSKQCITPATNENTYNNPDQCRVEMDACIAAMQGTEGYTCLRAGGAVLSSVGGTITDMGASVCLFSSHTNTSACSVCGKDTKYSIDYDGVLISDSSTSPSTSSDDSKFPELKADCEKQGGVWEETYEGNYTTTGRCKGGNVTTTSTSSTGSSGTDQNLNCGGTTGIACESTQLNSLNNLTDINKNIKDAFTLPSDAENCLVGTQCYKDKEKSILDNITKKLGDIPENLINLHTLVLSTYLVPFKDDKSAGTCNPASFIPITLSLTSIDGKVVSYVQPLPGDFLCRLFAIVRVFLVTGSLIVGFKLIVEAFVISS